MRSFLKSSAVAVVLLGFLASAAPVMASNNLPNPAWHNTSFTRSFSYNGQTCKFTFMYGNYGVGYAYLKLNSGCYSAVVGVISASGGNYYSAYGNPQPPFGFAQATAPAGNILEAQYCVSSGNASLMFGYNALNNTISYLQETPNGECY